LRISSFNQFNDTHKFQKEQKRKVNVDLGRELRETEALDNLGEFLENTETSLEEESR